MRRTMPADLPTVQYFVPLQGGAYRPERRVNHVVHSRCAEKIRELATSSGSSGDILFAYRTEPGAIAEVGADHRRVARRESVDCRLCSVAEPTATGDIERQLGEIDGSNAGGDAIA